MVRTPYIGSARTLRRYRLLTQLGRIVLVVLLEDRGNGATAPATLSWNGATLTQISQQQHSASTQRGIAIYYVYNPPVGTNNLTATVTGAGTTRANGLHPQLALTPTSPHWSAEPIPGVRAARP